MKKCPKCGAEIQENARFCLYCMTSFEEKKTIKNQNENRGGLYIIFGALALIVLLLSLLAVFWPERPSDGFESAGSDPIFSSGNEASESALSGDPSSDTASSSSQESTPSPSGSSSSSSKPASTGDSALSSKKTHSSSSEVELKPSSIQQSGNTSSAPAPSSEPAPSSSQPTAPSDPPSDPTPTTTYLYRDATPADDYASSASLTADAVVITGVETAAADGVYDIPETIGGKKVVAVMERAFCSDNVASGVKKVILPSNVKTINAYAFYDCYNMTDLYIKGEAVGCPSVIFPEKAKRNFGITVHASATCHDRNFHTYKTLCTTYFGTDFEEWNG